VPVSNSAALIISGVFAVVVALTGLIGVLYKGFTDRSSAKETMLEKGWQDYLTKLGADVATLRGEIAAQDAKIAAQAKEIEQVRQLNWSLQEQLVQSKIALAETQAILRKAEEDVRLLRERERTLTEHNHALTVRVAELESAQQRRGGTP
jgi:ABC-type glutathione transport system ATPase component